MTTNHVRTSLDVRLERSGAVGSVHVQHDVPIALTGAEWKALGAALSPDGRFTVRQLFHYVSQLVDADLRRRGIEAEPPAVRDYLQQRRVAR